MSFLDSLPQEISDALGGDFREGVVLVPARARSGTGQVTTSHTAGPAVRALRVQYDRTYATQNGIPDTDSRMLVLRHGLAVQIGMDHQVRYEGRDWKIVNISTDPADAVWELQVRPAA